METKLLTEAAWRRLFASNTLDEAIAYMGERGLIAPEPVDPLLIEAREIVASMPGLDALQAGAYRRGEWDAGGSVDIALAALKRGMEMRAPLTREMVREALQSDGWMASQDSAGTLHAAILKQMEQS